MIVTTIELDFNNGLDRVKFQSDCGQNIATVGYIKELARVGNSLCILSYCASQIGAQKTIAHDINSLSYIYIEKLCCVIPVHDSMHDS